MPSSPLTQNSHLISLTILLDGKEIEDRYLVTAVEVEREINRISKAKVVIVDGDPSQQDFSASEAASFLPGKEINIQAGYDGQTESIFKGVITRHKLRSRSGSRSELQLFCADKALKMTVGRNNQYYEKEKDSDVIKKIISRNGLAADVGATKVTHPKLVQYHATDWDFIISRAEVNGMVVNTRDGKVLVAAPKVSQSPVLKITYGMDLYDFDAELDAEYQMQGVTCRSWDDKTQELLAEKGSEPSLNRQGNQNGKKIADALSVSDFILQTTAPVPKPMLKAWADAELLKARLAAVRGFVEFKGNAKVYPDTLLELEGMGDRFNGQAYVSRVLHRIEEGDWVTRANFGLSAQWFVEEHANVTTLSAGGLLPGIEGLQNGKVKKIDGDPDGGMRILVDVPVIQASGIGLWARLASFYATKDSGNFFVPEVGDEVVLGFLNNDPNFPVVLGSLYNGKNQAPQKIQKENDIKTLVTRNKLKITFNEKDKDIIVETPGGQKVTLSDKGKSITLQDSNNNKVLLDKSGVTIDSSKDIVLNAKGQITLSAMSKIGLDAKADVSVAGLNVTHSAKASFSAEGKARAELKATGQTVVQGGIVMIN